MTPLLNLIMRLCYYSLEEQATESLLVVPTYNWGIIIGVRGVMNVKELHAAVREDWAKWQAVLALVGEKRMTEPGASGTWSVKDIITHITFFENEMVDLLQTRVLTGSDLWRLPQDERNRAIYERNCERALSDVLAESVGVHAQVARLLDDLTDADLLEAAHFKNMPAEWLPWRIIAENTFEHYRDHAEVVSKWLDAH
ncbi:MAG TPA: ClbS/DfsB family four-helix bundle protein [Anaerolineae bacterium]